MASVNGLSGPDVGERFDTMKLVPVMRSGRLAALLSAVFLSGCATTGGLHPFATPTDPARLQTERSFSGVKLDAAAWPRRGWWRAVGDRQLDELVAEALADNPDMTLVQARVNAALATVSSANAARLPELSGGGSMSGARLPPMLPPLASGHFGFLRYGYLSFKWNPDLWGGERAAWEAAVGEARATEVDAEAARLRLSADVAQAYFNLGAAYVQRDLARDELQRATDFLGLTRKRVASGIENKLTLAQIESEAASDQGRLKAANNHVRASGLVLAVLLGKGPDRALSIRRPELPAIPTLALPSDLPANLLGRRPDVVAARWRVEAAEKNIVAAKTKFLPNVNISALAGVIAPTATTLLSLPSRFYEVAPAFSLPIFEGGALRANLAGKDAARDVAVAQYNQTLVRAVNQVATQVDDLRSLSLQLTDDETARAGAAHAYSLAMARYRAGIGNFLEALTERQELIAAEQRLAATRVGRVEAWVRLNEALGGGFRADAAVPSLAAVHPLSESRVNQ